MNASGRFLGYYIVVELIFLVVLSSETGFQSGTPCNLGDDVPLELSKLTPGAYDYEIDSDLESLLDEENCEPLEASTEMDDDDSELLTPVNTPDKCVALHLVQHLRPVAKRMFQGTC
jgi:hypothetical protein